MDCYDAEELMVASVYLLQMLLSSCCAVDKTPSRGRDCSDAGENEVGVFELGCFSMLGTGLAGWSNDLGLRVRAATQM
jgi:hypothetical protein